MTVTERHFPRGWRERLALWLIGDQPVCANVRIPAGTAIECVPEGRELLFATSCERDVSAYARMARELEEGIVGDVTLLGAAPADQAYARARETRDRLRARRDEAFLVEGHQIADSGLDYLVPGRR